MQIIIGFLVLLLIALIGSHSLRSLWSPPSIVRRLFDNGLIFIAVGMAVGPAGLNLLTTNVLEKAGPVVVLFLGWIGFLFGVHLEWRRLRRVMLRMWVIAFSQALLTFSLVSFAAYMFFTHRLPVQYDSTILFAAVITLAACAAGTTPASVFLLDCRPRFSGRIAQAMRLVGTVDDLPGLLIFGLFFAFFPTYHVGAIAWKTGLGLAVLTILLGVLFGILLKSLILLARNEQTALLVVFGVISLAAGFAEYIHLSAVFVGTIAGITFANLSGQKETVYRVLASSEHTIYVLFLVLVGCLWSFNTAHLLPLALLYLGVRTLGKILGGLVGHRIVGAPPGRMRLGGLGLLGQGGMAIAMAINYERLYQSPISSLVVTVLILGVVANELIGPTLAAIPFGREPRRQEERP